MEFKYYVIIACLALGVFLFFKEISRNNKSQLIGRLLASLVMMVSFVFLLIPITYTIQKEEAVHELNLITEGTIPDTIAAINAQKYTLDSSMISNKKGLNVKYIEDLAYYLQGHPEIKKVNIYGYGLQEEELDLLKSQQVSFHASASPSGINSANWQKKIKATETLEVQGIYHNSTSQNIQVKLYGMGSTLDSIGIKANDKAKFSFRTEPKQIGKAIYKLIALQGKDTLSIEPVPFEVIARQPLKVLILASFPDFEYKFLKKWLYENQFPVVFRTQISKDKYSSDFLNTKTIDISRIHTSLLKHMDVLIIDEEELSAIGIAERAAIDAAVSDGMGLVVRITNAKPDGLSQRFKRLEVASPSAKTLDINGVEDSIRFSELPFAQTLFLEPTASEQSLFKASNGRTVVSANIKGMGKVLVSSVTSTYQWELAGKKSDYAKYWSTLLNKVARKEITTQSFEIVPAFLAVGERARLIISMADMKVPALQFNNIKLAPRQNMELPFKWDGVFWPLLAGWDRVTLNQKPENIFVYKKTEWKSLKNTQKRSSTLNFIENQSLVDFSSKKVAYLTAEELSKWWFFGLFLLSASFLWYEQRFLANK